MFAKFAGSDEVLDARELKQILNHVFKGTEFSKEECRTFVSQWDVSFLWTSSLLLMNPPDTVVDNVTRIS
ncbi:hypothetical protein LSAT2_013290 [Lamellibrachia satsuma]|nr:hypothetical protein LSAT2_013290 [Lamellibrachia satsuma]